MFISQMRKLVNRRMVNHDKYYVLFSNTQMYWPKTAFSTLGQVYPQEDKWKCVEMYLIYVLVIVGEGYY